MLARLDPAATELCPVPFGTLFALPALELRLECVLAPHLYVGRCGFDYDFGFRLRLHCLGLHRHELRCFERSADALACIAVAERLQSSNSLVHGISCSYVWIYPRPQLS